MDYSRWAYDQICKKAFTESTVLANYEMRVAAIRGKGLIITHKVTGQRAPKAVYNLLRREWFYEVFEQYFKHFLYGVSVLQFSLNIKGEVQDVKAVERGLINTVDGTLRVPEDADDKVKYQTMMPDDADPLADFNYRFSPVFFELLEGGNIFATGKIKQVARHVEEKSANSAYWHTFNQGFVTQTFVYKTKNTNQESARQSFKNIEKVPEARLWLIHKDEDFTSVRSEDYQAHLSFKEKIKGNNQEIGKAINSATIDGEEINTASAAEIRERSFNTSISYAREKFSLMVQDRLIPFLYALPLPFSIQGGPTNPYIAAKLEDYFIEFEPQEINVTNEQSEPPAPDQKKAGNPNAQ